MPGRRIGESGQPGLRYSLDAPGPGLAARRFLTACAEAAAFAGRAGARRGAASAAISRRSVSSSFPYAALAALAPSSCP